MSVTDVPAWLYYNLIAPVLYAFNINLKQACTSFFFTPLSKATTSCKEQYSCLKLLQLFFLPLPLINNLLAPEMLEGGRFACMWRRDRRPYELPPWHLPCLARMMQQQWVCLSWITKGSSYSLSRHNIPDELFAIWDLIFTWTLGCQVRKGLSPYR